MATISLEGSLRTCKVDTAWANRIQSDRFENPSLMVCPVWNGFDNAGRPVCADSFVTKSPGCNSSLDRVYVENSLRPQYMEYINLDAEGIRANIYKSPEDYNMYHYDAGIRTAGLQNVPKITGRFGNVDATTALYPSCNIYPYPKAQEQEAGYAEWARKAQAAQHGFQGHQFKKASGF